MPDSLSKRVYLLGAFLLFATLNLCHAKTGDQILKERLPTVYKALTKSIGVNKTKTFLADWTKSDVAYFEAKLFGALKSQASGETPEDFLKRYQKLLIGTMGEVHAIVASRSRIDPRANFLNEMQYLSQNFSLPTRHRPDGIYYKIEGNKLVIVAIIESKAGTSKYNAAQVQAYLDNWRNKGLYIGETLFAPQNIVLRRQGQGDIAVTQANLSDAEEVLLLIQHNLSRKPRPRVIQIPITAIKLREFAANLAGATLSDNERKSLVNGWRLYSQKVHAKTIKALNEWIRKNKAWPIQISGQENTEQFRLARWVSAHGGRPALFEYVLTRRNKSYFWVRLEGEPSKLLRWYRAGRLQLTEAQVFELLMKMDPDAALNRWVADNERFPKQSKRKGDTSQENRLATYMNKRGNRVDIHYRHLNEANQQLFWIRFEAEPERLYADYQAGRIPPTHTPTQEQIFELRMAIRPEDAINAWIANHKTWPQKRRGERGTEEYRLANWVSDFGGRQGVYDAFLTPENKRLFAIRMELHPETLYQEFRSRSTRLSPEQIWRLSLRVEPKNALNRWIAKNGAKPKKTANNVGTEEHQIADYIAKQGGWAKALEKNLISPSNLVILGCQAVTPEF